MSFVGPGDVVTYLYWLEQVQKLGLGDASTPGAKERRMFEESGEFNLKVYDSGWVKCNRDADFLNGNAGSYYLDASNLNAGTISRGRLGALWRDISDQTQNPYFQTGEKTIPTGGSSELINFDIAFSQVPRVVTGATFGQFGAITSISTTGFQLLKSSYSYVAYWLAIGRKD
jgi:hypothetical protein